MTEGIKEKYCSGCETTKPIEDFSIHKRDGYKSDCKACSAARMRAYREDNREKVSKRKKAYREGNKEKLRDYYRAYAENNKGKIRKYYQENREEILLKEKEYRKLNPGKFRAKSAKNRVTKLNRTPEWLTPEQKSMIEDFYWLAKDLEVVTGEKYHVDHIVPLRGKHISGLHVPWNLQILPADLNLSKKNKFDV